MMERVMDLSSDLTWKSVLIGAVVGLVVYWIIRKRRYKKPPGPFALPLIGNYELLGDAYMYKKCMEMMEKYGPIFKIYLGPFETIILNNIEVVTEALVKRGADFANRPLTTTGVDFTEGSKDIAFAPYSATWKLHRKIVSKALRNCLKGNQLQDAVDVSLNRMIQELKKQTEAFDPAEYCDFVVFNVLSYLCYKQEFSFDDPEFKRLMKLENDFLEALGMGTLEDLFPIIKKICPTKKYRTVMSVSDEVNDIINRKLKEHRETFDLANIRDFTDSLLLARQEAEEEDDATLLNQLTEAHLRQTLGDIFFAGIDTSRFTLNWALLFMAGHPDIQTKCQQELDTIVGRNRGINLEDKQRLPYTDACLMEIMRLGMAAPIGLPHSALCDSKIAGYDIQKGTILIINHYALHMDPRHWEDPIKFDPNRYLDDKGNMKQKPESWLPFSAGRRVCLGESIAKPELFTIFASLIHHFRISLPPGVDPVFDPKGGAIDPSPKPYKIIVKERN